MNQALHQVITAGGVESRLPQEAQNANKAINLRIDKKTGGWSTRIGFEKYMVGATSWSPFTNTGPISSLHVAQGLAGGARQQTLFESEGSLFLLYEAGESVPSLQTIASGRHIPTPTEPGSWYTDTPYGTVVTNGVDRPILVHPWPLGSGSQASATISQVGRDFGFTAPPPTVTPFPVLAFPGRPALAAPQNPTPPGGRTTCLWAPSSGPAISDGARWGLGFASNDDAEWDKEALFGYACSFISDTGSEGPSSTLASVSWQLGPAARGFRHGIAMELPIGPEGTVARKVYRTTNYSDDYTSPGDTTLYFVGLVRNNLEQIYFDPVRTADLGQASPAIPTGPLPAPRARFSALFKGCLWLDGGVDDSRTLYYSAPGLIEQFDPASYLELSAEGGAITALFGNYTNLLIFRESGIDHVTGDFASGFQVVTLSNSITCRAPHSVAVVPGLGVLFLAQDGVYALLGGTVGGAQLDLVNLTERQDDIIDRITPDCRAKAVGAYSPELREFHLYLPVDGNDRPNLGLIYHIERLGVDGAPSPWSTREGFPVGALAARHDGSLLFGHNTGDQAGAGTENNRGLFVISGRRSTGMDYDPVTQAFTYSGPPTSTYRSAWFDFGDPQTQKQVTYVTLWMLTTGQPTITIRHFKDFDQTAVAERTYRAQPPDAADLPTFDLATLDTDTYKTGRLVPLRFSVAHQSCAWFCWEFETTDDLILVGWEAMYTSKGTKVVFGKRA